MASILYIGFDRDDKIPGLRKDALLATADLDRISRAYASILFPSDANPTGEEVFTAIVEGVLQAMLANTVNWERSEAAKVAQAQVPPIVIE